MRGGGIDPHGYDAGKKVKGKKRQILVDTLGLLLHAIIHPADIQDRDGGILLLATLFGMYPFLKKLFADGGYQGPDFQKVLAKILPQWPAPGSEDTELGVLMELEVGDGETEVYPRVQA